MASRAVHPFYLLVDTSGSTLEAAWLERCNQALPLVVDALESGGDAALLAILGCGSKATVHMRLSPVHSVTALPQLRSSGFTSLSAGLRRLRTEIEIDVAQLRADDIAVDTVTAVVVAQGLPTDRSEDVLAARAELSNNGSGTRTCLHLLAEEGTDILALHGLAPSRLATVPPRSQSAALPGLLVNALSCASTCQRGS